MPVPLILDPDVGIDVDDARLTALLVEIPTRSGTPDGRREDGPHRRLRAPASRLVARSDGC